MTERLYYSDVMQKEFIATIREVREKDGTVQICTDRTAFYPEGGGQGADHGLFLLTDGTERKVLDVQEEGDTIWHTLSGPVSAGQEVKGIIDWDRRFDHMQQHSGEHIVSGMICRAFHCDNVGFHMGEDIVTIDYNAEISYEQIQEIEARANAYIWEDHPLKILWPAAEELKTLEYRSKKELEGAVRITEFPGADRCACCGTHVPSSAQVGLVTFLSAKKFHDGTRLELLCGKRAWKYLADNSRRNKAAAVLMSTSEENTEDRVRRMIGETNSLKTAVADLEEDLFRLQAEQLKDRGNVVLIEEKRSALQGRRLADLTADLCGGIAIVFTPVEGGFQYAAVCRSQDIADLIRQMNADLSGRGGGRNGFAQGSVHAGKKEILHYFKEKLHFYSFTD